MTETNRQVRLRARPEGIPQARHFEVTEEPLGPLAEGRFRVRNAYLSVDPAMRGWLSGMFFGSSLRSMSATCSTLSWIYCHRCQFDVNMESQMR